MKIRIADGHVIRQLALGQHTTVLRAYFYTCERNAQHVCVSAMLHCSWMPKMARSGKRTILGKLSPLFTLAAIESFRYLQFVYYCR